jgi:Fe2+ transport system protein FeoA
MANISAIRTMAIRTMDSLKPGEAGSIIGFADPPADLAERLGELGFEIGAMVELRHSGPIGGDPRAFAVGGATIALRRSLARVILLAPEG